MRVRPSALTLLYLFSIGALDWVIPEMRVHFPGQFLIASAIGTTGLILILLSIRGSYRTKSTVLSDAMDQSTALVIDGLYQISRNQMYLGMAAIILGAGLALATWITLPVLTAFVWIISTFQIKPEEQALETIFGDAFSQYISQVRRWI